MTVRHYFKNHRSGTGLPHSASIWLKTWLVFLASGIFSWGVFCLTLAWPESCRAEETVNTSDDCHQPGHCAASQHSSAAGNSSAAGESHLPADSGGQNNGSNSLSESIVLDLSSSQASLIITQQILGEASSANILVGSNNRTVSAGDQVTPAEFAAVAQVAASGTQSLMLDNTGRAVSGSIMLDILSSQAISNLVIPQNVLAVGNHNSGLLDLSGSLVTQGTFLAAVSSDLSANFTVNANRIEVLAGGLITTTAPAWLSLPFNINTGPLALSLISATDIVNMGTIAASGNLSLLAGGTITNGSTAIIQSMANVNMETISGQITNAGLIQSLSSNVLISSISGADLLFNNLGGTLTALNGEIALRTNGGGAASILDVTGGKIDSLLLNFLTEGTVRAAVHEITGMVNVKASQSHVFVESGILSLGAIDLSGDPTFVNSGGNIILNPNGPGGVLRFAGEDLAVIAYGNVLAGAGLNTIDLSAAAAGNSGSLTIIAGVNVSPSAGFQIEETAAPFVTYTLGMPSASGGSIQLSGVSIKTSVSSGPYAAGIVRLIAYDNDNMNQVNTAGAIAIGSIDTSSNQGTAGDVLFIAQAGSLNVPSINASGVSEGNIFVQTGKAEIQDTITFFNGTMAGGNFILDEDTGHEPVAVILTGNIAAGSTANILIDSAGSITLAPSISIEAGNILDINSRQGGINLSGNNQLTAGSGMILYADGTGGDVVIGAGSTLIAGQALIVISDKAQVTDLGFTSYTSLFDSVVIGAEQNISLGNNTGISAGDGIALLSLSGSVSTGNNSSFIAPDFIGFIGGQSVTIGTGNTIEAGSLAGGALPFGLLAQADILHAGDILLLAADGSLALNSSLTANGGNLIALAQNGDIMLANGTQYIAHGGFIVMFSSEAITGNNNLFYSRAAGEPNNFTGGVISLSAGFSFNPLIFAMGRDIFSNEAQVDDTEKQILSRADKLNAFINNPTPHFQSPELDANKFVLDPTIMGHNVLIDNNGIDLGLVWPTTLIGGSIDVSNSYISMSKGALFLDAVGTNATVNLPNSVFMVESYDVFPTGFLEGFADLLMPILPERNTTIQETATIPTIKELYGTVSPLDQLRISVGVKEFQGQSNSRTQTVEMKSARVSGRTNNFAASFSEIRDVGLINTGHTEAAKSSYVRVDLNANTTLASSFSNISSAIGVTTERHNQPSPVVQVSEKRSDLILFTEASQMIKGDIGGSKNAAVIGARGTAISADEDQLVMHIGKIIADTGSEPLRIATPSGKITVSANTTASIAVGTDGAVKVIACGGNRHSSISLQSNDSSQAAISIRPGQQMNVIESAKEADSPFRPIADGLAEQTRQLVVGIGSASISEFCTAEAFSSNRSMRLTGARKAGCQRIASRILTVAKEEEQNSPAKINSASSGNLSEASASLFAEHSPLRVLAEHGAMVQALSARVIRLHKGTIFVQASRKHQVLTELASINLSAGASVSIDAEPEGVRVRCFSGPKQVEVDCAGKKIAMNPAEELFLSKEHPTKRDALPSDGIGRRQLTLHKLSSGIFAVTGDFSIVSALNNVRSLKPIRAGVSLSDKNALKKTMKTAAVMNVVTGKRGRFFAPPTETANLPADLYKDFAERFVYRPCAGQDSNANKSTQF